MTVVNTKILNVDEKAQSYAGIYASLINDEMQRKRAYASIVALYSLIYELETLDIDIQKSMTLFRNPTINQQYEIADLYVNNWHIDVRVVTEGNGFLVPKSHFDVDIVPDFYAVVRVDNSLKTAELLGFADTALLQKEPFDYHYYGVSFDSLVSYEEFISKIKNVKLTNFPEQEHEFFKANYLSLMDGEIDLQTKNRLLKHLFECAQCRTEFCCFTGFEMVSCNMGKYPNILEDQTLEFIGAQAVDNEKYEGKEETIYIGDDSEENKDEEPSPEQETEQEDIQEQALIDNETIELKEETVSDILDELFNVGDDILSTDIIEEKDIDTTPQKTISEYDDLEIIEDIEEDSPSDGVVAYQEIKNDIEDLEVLVDDSVELLSDDSNEVVLIESEPIEFKEEDLEIKPSEEVEIVEEIVSTQPSMDENVQKVIVDYDEYGEPIYSYITNVSSDGISHIEPVDEDMDILNEEFETYTDDLVEEDLSGINNGAARPIEYIQPLEEDTVLDEGLPSENIVADDHQEEELDSENADEALKELILDEKQDDVEIENDGIEELELEQEFEEYNETDDSEDIQNVSDDDFLELDDEDTKSEVQNEDMVEPDEQFEEYKEIDDDSLDEEEYEEYSDEEEDVEYSEDEEYEEDDESEERTTKSSPKKNILIISALLTFAVVGLGVGAFFFKNGIQQTVAQNPAPTETNLETPVDPQVNDMFEAAEGGIEIPSGDVVEGELVPPPPPIEESNQEPPTSGTLPVPPPVDIPVEVTSSEVSKQSVSTPATVSNSIASAFSPTTNTVTLRAVNWLCAPQLFADSAFKAYLQELDNILKLNLRKNILDISESPTNDTVIVKMAVDNNGNLLKVAMGDSSGSTQVDNVVLQSINETFEGEKSPILNDSAQKADKYYLKVVIKL